MESEFASVGGGDHFVVEDLLDFSNETTGVVVDDVTATTTTTTGGGSNSSTSSAAVDDVTSTVTSNGGGPHFANNGCGGGGGGGGDVPFSADLCVPSDDLAELEWLSNFVEESFSSEDLHKLQLLPGVNSAFKTNKIRPESDPKYEQPSEIHYYHSEPIQSINSGPNQVFNPDLAVPGKARSKRSRVAPGNWSSRLLLLSPGPGTDPARHEAAHWLTTKPIKAAPKKKSGPRSRSGHELPNGEARRCLHCATDKTPQWRTGPLGPKTLCNACGVRYKSGRLVPEYRPAASPTFVMTKHSNSHRKVMELRRQKDLQKQHQLIIQQQQRQQQLMHDPNSMIFDPPNSDDYLIHQHIGPDFRQLI